MSAVLDQLIAQLSLEQIEENLFRGQSQDLGWGRVYGGQVLGQSLAAATQTVPSDRIAHSLHAYFLRPGAVDRPIIYDVDRIRDGSSFATRRVVAIQNGKAIFHMSASFQLAEEGLDHQDVMPEVTPPNELPSELALLHQISDRLPPATRSTMLATRPIEFHPVAPQHELAPTTLPPDNAIWMRAAGPLPDTPWLHQALLTYASDFSFIPTSLRPHGVTWASRKLQVASIDHAIWFHRPMRMDQWLLHVIHSPTASGARGLVRGSVFSQDGRLVASTMQEGLIRLR